MQRRPPPPACRQVCSPFFGRTARRDVVAENKRCSEICPSFELEEQLALRPEPLWSINKSFICTRSKSRISEYRRSTLFCDNQGFCHCQKPAFSVLLNDSAGRHDIFVETSRSHSENSISTEGTVPVA